MLLLIDTAFDLCQVGLWQDGILIASQSAPGEARHDVILAPLVEKLLHDNNQTVSDLSGIAVMTGPGRFTSLRVGIAFARALIIPHPHIPLYGMATADVLRAYHATQKTQGDPAVLIAVKRGEIFVQANANDEPVSHPLVDLANVVSGAESIIAIGAGIPDDWQQTLPSLPCTVLTALPLAAIGLCAERLYQSGAAHAVVRPFYGASTGAGY